MDQNQEIIDNFEALLKKNTTRKPFRLYSTNETPNKPKTEPILNSAKDVLVNVCKQIKAIQNADAGSSKRTKILNKYKKKEFSTVDMLPVYKEVHPKKPMKFETQCVSDTQLISLIENAEIIDKHRGVTQEFDTTFCQKSDDSDSDDKTTLDSKITDLNPEEKDDVPVNKDVTSEMDTLTCIQNDNGESNDETGPSDHQKVIINDHKSDDDRNRCTSPVLNAHRRSPPLVYSLYTFEKFENLALPIIEEHTDLQTAKNIINSQIIGSELFIPNHIYENNDRQSPVLNNIENISYNADENVTNENTIKPDIKEAPNTPEIFDLVEDDDLLLIQPKEHIKTEIKDEILFSSDEEEDYLHKEVQELPLTCALETSFYEKSDILDKTMYVGFQTASNKSIQISTDSFSKARSILSAVVSEETSIQALVEIFDTERENNENLLTSNQTEKDNVTRQKNTNTVESGFIKKVVNLNEPSDKIEEEIGDTFKNESFTALERVAENNDILMSQVIPFKSITSKHNISVSDIFEESVVSTKRKLEGFKTASNKKIKLSDKALVRCKKVFQDIDIYENFDANCDTDTNHNVKSQVKETDNMNVSQDIFEIKKEICVKEDMNEKIESKKENVEDLQINDQDFLQDFLDVDMPFDKTEITVSESSINESKDIFRDILVTSKENNICNNVNFEDEKVFKKPEVSEKVLIKQKKILSDVKVHEFIENHSDFDKPSTSKFIGFKTAANKEIKITPQVMEKMKNFYKDVDNDLNTNVNIEKPELAEEKYLKDVINTEDLFAEELLLNEDFFKDSIVENNDPEIPVFKGFQTASNKAITISEKAFQISKKLFEHITNTEGDDANIQHSQKSNNNENKVAKVIKDVKNKEFIKPSLAFSNAKDTEDVTVNENPLEIKYKEINNLQKEIPIFKGFQTASNKPVKISDQALAKSKKLFQDINLSQTTEEAAIEISKDPAVERLNKNNDTNKFVGFKTASYKPVSISADALAKSKKILKDLEVINNEDSNNKRESSDLLNTKFVGFQTASNKEVKISKQAMDKCKQIFNDIEFNKNLPNYKQEIDNFSSFKTASNKEITAPKDPLAKSEQIFNDIEFQNNDFNENPAENHLIGFKTADNKGDKTTDSALATSQQVLSDIQINKNDLDEEPADSNFVGFKTANNKEVKISKQALDKCKQIFNDIDLDKDNLNDKQETGNFFGFKTANNDEVNISEDALAKSKRIVNDFDFNDGSIDKPESTTFAGFKTAGNKKVKISEEALAKSKVIFEDINAEENSVVINEVKDMPSPVFKGFQTASNKQVKISERALEKSKKLFQDLDVCENVEKADTGNEIKAIFHGFQTASRKKVNVSEKGLERSKKLFQDLDVCENVEDVNTRKEESKVFRGFQTASKKKVDISEKALAIGRKVFEGIEISQKEIPAAEKFNNFEKKIGESNESFPKSFAGFQTANKKKVVISEQALAKTKAIFNEELNEPITSTMSVPDVKLPKITIVTDTSNKNQSTTEQHTVKTNINKDIIDTQVLNDFQETLNTEDFCKDTPKSKRSGSPILSCPRAKKRKFEAPYRNDKKIHAINTFVPPKITNTYQFKEDYKKNKRYTLKDLQKLENDAKVDIDPYTTKFNFENLLNFEFFGSRNDYTEGKFDVNQIKKLFLDSVNRKIVPDGWIENHVKLIIWKLLSYEIKFPTAMKNVCTVRNVMDQLKYRYDKELYNVQRPILRKILEKDDVPSKTMVLCVAAVYVDDISVASVPTAPTNIELLLTDGWYCVRGTIDRMLSQLVCNGSIVVGCKIATSGAELVNCEQGVAPWEDTSSVRLKLHGNSTRLARWRCALGARAGAVACGLRGRVDGGRGAGAAVLARTYPLLAVLKGEGGAVILSERLENIRQMKLEAEQQALMEKLYEELEKELDDQESQDSDSYTIDKTSCFDTGSQICKMMKKSRDPDEYRSHLTTSQNALLEEHNTRKREKKMEEIRVKFQEKMEKCGLKKDNVAHLLKVRLVDFKENGSGVEVNKGYLSIWNPSSAVTEMMTEGTWIEIQNFIPTGMRNGEIQLSAGRQTVFKPYDQKNEKYKLYANTLKRKCYEIKELAQNPNMTTDYDEIDTVGIIFQIEPSTKEFDEKKQNFQNVFLADADKNMICVNFWGGLKKFGFENVLDTGQIITCVNLQKRAGNSRKSIPQYRVTEFSYFTKTPKDKRAAELTSELSDKLSKIKEKFCEDCVVLKNNYSIFKTRNVDNVSPYRYSPYNMPKKLESPLNCDSNLNLTGLDFESTFTTQMSPEQLLRKKRVKEKIDRLKMYGEPPPLSSIHIINKSKNASATYKSPLLSKDKVASNENTPQNVTSIGKENFQSDTSPVGLNRTFVKRVNPVKLNFSNSVAIENDLNDSVDHFADDFEASPPLSLDSDVVL